MATKGVKTYKFTSRSGDTIRKVKFYASGIYTITDNNGEHECGIWMKKPMLVGKYNDKPSKDPNRVVYFATSFTPYSDKSLFRMTQYTMKELAEHLLNWEVMKNML